MTGNTKRARVLVVDDEPDYVDAYADWLSKAYDVQTAMSGKEAIEAMDDSIDVVLLDRRMPDRSGDEVLDIIRDRGFDTPIAMVTGVEPELDIVDLEFDEYLVKPVTETDLINTVQTLLVRRSFDDQIKKCFSLVARRTALESSMDPAALEQAEEYQRLQSRIRALERRATEQLDDLIASGVVDRAYADIDS